uniref:Uncharacterized protein n=1 Tax=Eutreptiella gymnastica TaxID=73025 RepID=A0A7S4GKF9_9EUGL|mmetsp:Transcript_86841/g.144497  ORF Transcript_86841/g.144497 Transcript_86841/m.144497 type:complete len:157 (-) Transcript_86841:385-855(-)
MGCCLHKSKDEGFLTAEQLVALEQNFASIPGLYYRPNVDQILLLPPKGAFTHFFNAQFDYELSDVDATASKVLFTASQAFHRMEDCLTQSDTRGLHMKTDTTILSVFPLKKSQYLMAIFVSAPTQHDIAGLDTEDLQKHIASTLESVDDVLCASNY